MQAKASLYLICLAGLAFGSLSQSTSDAAEEDWPKFLGPRGSNISDATNLLERWPGEGPRVVWEKEVGSGYSAPSVLGQRLVLHHRVGDQEIVECFDSQNGDSLWRYGYPSHFADPFGYNNGPRSTPTLTSSYCFTFGAEGRLVCLELATGKPVWQRETAKDWNVPEPFFGAGSTPLLEEGKLIVMVGGQPNSTIVALDAPSGKTIWESVGRTTWEGARTIGWRGESPYRWTGEEKLASYSSPVAATIHGQRHILCFARQGLVSLNPTNGAVHFSRWFQSQVNESVNAMSPVVWDDMVFIAAAYYHIGGVLLRVRRDGNSFEEVWSSPAAGQRYERDPVHGGLVQPVLELHWNTPVLHAGYLYAFSGRNEPDATFRCVDFKTGKLMWSRDERWRPHSSTQPAVYGRGSAILADGKLIVLGEGGKLGLFALNPNEPKEICAWQVPQLHYPCWAAPVLSRAKLYLRSEDRLLCLDLARK